MNNAWATVASKLSQTEMAAAATAEQSASPVLLLAATTAIVVLAALLFRTRTRYVQADGQEWDPGYFTVEAPPHSQVLHRDFGSITGRNLAHRGFRLGGVRGGVRGGGGGAGTVTADEPPTATSAPGRPRHFGQRIPFFHPNRSDKARS